MSQRWLKFLEKFGSRGKTENLDFSVNDLVGAGDDRRFLGRGDVLFHLFGPHPQSPWVPYHCPTLFASIGRSAAQRQRKIVELSPGYHEEPPDGAWQWLTPDTMVIVDLPNGTAVEVAVTLMKVGAQPVCTFDHWARSTVRRGARVAVDSRHLMDVLFTLATDVHPLRKTMNAEMPPVWVCDSRRLGGRLSPSPGTFDNRYFIDDSILPGIRTLKKAGISTVVYFGLRANIEPLPDLVPFLREAHNQGLTLCRVALQEKNTWIKPPIMRAPFEQKLPIRGFRRTDRGGFGNLVPQPSEGSYSSGGGGG